MHRFQILCTSRDFGLTITYILSTLFLIACCQHYLESIGKVQLGVHCAMMQATWQFICDFQQCSILTSVDSDEPVQPPFKLRNFKLCSVNILTLTEYLSD